MPIIYDPDFDLDDFLDAMERRRPQPRADLDVAYFDPNGEPDAEQRPQYKH